MLSARVLPFLMSCVLQSDMLQISYQQGCTGGSAPWCQHASVVGTHVVAECLAKVSGASGHVEEVEVGVLLVAYTHTESKRFALVDICLVHDALKVEAVCRQVAACIDSAHVRESVIAQLFLKGSFGQVFFMGLKVPLQTFHYIMPACCAGTPPRFTNPV